MENEEEVGVSWIHNQLEFLLSTIIFLVDEMFNEPSAKNLIIPTTNELSKIKKYF